MAFPFIYRTDELDPNMAPNGISGSRNLNGNPGGITGAKQS